MQNHVNCESDKSEECELSEKLCKNDLENLKSILPPDQASELESVTRNFLSLYKKFLNYSPIQWDEIKLPSKDSILELESLPMPSPTEIRTLLNKLVVVKLNGGLGTTMGCSGPKSLIEVRDNKSFLTITIEQLESINSEYQCNIPLVLMNSYNTQEDTARVLESLKNRYKTEIFTFLQHRFPRLSQQSRRPIFPSKNFESKTIWYPPGHGDLYDSFWNSPLFSQFVNNEKEVAFISNIDNLGATIDFRIIQLLLQSSSSSKPDFLMEVTPKTKADVKGGTPICYKNKLTLMEIMQVPPDHIEDFKSLKKFKIFNTNNIWLNLISLDSMMKQKNGMDLDVIVNKKTICEETQVIQLETAIGSAIKCFASSLGVVVPRSRFLPVKNNSDLFLLKSNLYHMSNGVLKMNSLLEDVQTTPLVKFVGKYFKDVKQFLERFGNIPNIVELEHLTVSGDVTFGKDISLKGTVIIIANVGERIDIPSGSVLENKIVTGSLRILEY